MQVLRDIDREDLNRDIDATPEPFASVLRLALASDPLQRRVTMAEVAEQVRSANADLSDLMLEKVEFDTTDIYLGAAELL